jgi:DNA polymerase I-like protein with 3'-5' exonuclease and polymerase domains
VLIQADVKSLELVAAAYLSQDETLIDEIRNKVDLHEANRSKFGLPTRLVAKTLVFRTLYGGSAYSFTKDPEFKSVSTKQDFWEKAIYEFYNKYEGIYLWHRALMHEATTTGRVVSPTGRFYPFSSYQKGGDIKWPSTNIKNYPVQGLGADLVAIYRVQLLEDLRRANVSGVLCSSVHDSVVCDIPASEADLVRGIMHDGIGRVPQLFEERFGVEFNLPLGVEVLVGPNMGDMNEY